MVKTKIDGKYIEDLISGFRTLGVDGREEIDLDVTSAETETSDGGRFVRRKINSRVLRVHFHLSDATASGFSTKLKALQAKLYSVKESRIIFSDASNYYFTGSFRKLTLAYKGMTVTRGTFEIFCADPFRYFVTESVVYPTDGVFTVNYIGTYPAHPTLIARSPGHDCGFYGFTKDGLTIRVGNPDEQDQEEVPSETARKMVDTQFGSGHDWYTWSWARARLLYGYYTDNYSAGTSADYIYSYTAFPGAEPDYYYGPAYGTYLVEPVPNFNVSFTHWFEPSGNQGGGFDFYINNQGGSNIAGVSIYRNKGGRIQVSMIARGTVVKQVSFSLTDNPFKGDWRTQTITKSLGTITFNVGGVTYSVTDPELAGHAYDAYNASFVFYRQPGAEDIGTNNALQAALFYGYNNDWQEVTNKIPQNGLVSIDTASGNITLNGAQSLGLGVITNNFEDFTLTPGSNAITCEASDWVDDAEYTLKYREAYL